MSRLLYDTFLSLYYGSALLLSPFHARAEKWIAGRKQVWDELKKLNAGQKKRVWFHCASLGEYEQALPLIEKFSPSKEVIVTFFSPSGYEIVKRKKPEALVFYLPHDSKSNAKKFLGIIQPELAVFVRYDLWHHYLKELRERNVHTILISAVFKEQDVFFQWYGGLFRDMLQCFTHIFVQDDASKSVLSRHGFKNVTQAGDTRIDRVIAIREMAKHFPEIEAFRGAKKIFIIGSLEPKDEGVVLPLLQQPEIIHHYKFIIAPHDVGKNNVQRLRAKIKASTALYSEASSRDLPQCDVLLIDGIGMLSALYRYAHIAYIGGGFGEGLHNILEPAAWGVPLLFGPKYHKFLEAVELVERGGARVVNSADDLFALVSERTAEGGSHALARSCVLKYLDERKGGAEAIFHQLSESGKTM